MNLTYDAYRAHRVEAARHMAVGNHKEALISIDAAIMTAPDSELMHIAADLRKQIAPKVERFYWLRQIWGRG